MSIIMIYLRHYAVCISYFDKNRDLSISHEVKRVET